MTAKTAKPKDPRDFSPTDYNSPLPTMRTTFHNMTRAEQRAAKLEVKKAEALVDPLYAKFKASLSPEQEAMRLALRKFDELGDAFFPEHLLEAMRDGMVVHGNVYTLERVLADCQAVEAALAATPPADELAQIRATVADRMNDAELDARIAKQDARDLARLDAFAKHYPPAVIRELRDCVLEAINDGEAPNIKQAVDVLSCFNEFLDLCAFDDYNPAKAREKANSQLADRLQEAIGTTLALLVVETGKFAAWI